MPKEKAQEHKKVTSIGLDLSLVGTGVVVLEDNIVVRQELIKSKPSGDKPVDELRRIRKIVEDIEMIISEYRPDVAVIENLAFAVRSTTSLTQLAGLSFLVRAMLYDYRVPFYLCAPTSLKKFATGKGNSEKDHMMLEAFKQYQIDGIDNNVADAVFLSKIGSCILGCGSTKELHQIEVVELIKKQI